MLLEIIRLQRTLVFYRQDVMKIEVRCVKRMALEKIKKQNRNHVIIKAQGREGR